MSLKLQYIGSVPEEAARIAKAAFPERTTYMNMKHELGAIFEDEDFADLLPRRRPQALAPWRLALVRNLPDRQAAGALRACIDRKYGLALVNSRPRKPLGYSTPAATLAETVTLID